MSYDPKQFPEEEKDRIIRMGIEACELSLETLSPRVQLVSERKAIHAAKRFLGHALPDSG